MLRKNRKIEDRGSKIEKAGFTLIELLVVIAVVGFLGALIVPTISSSKDRAKEAICINNLRQLGIAANIYFDEHNDLIPTATDMKTYIDDRKVFICPNEYRSEVDGINKYSYEVWGPSKWMFDDQGVLVYQDGKPVEKTVGTNKSEQALFIETAKTYIVSDPATYPKDPNNSNVDIIFPHRNYSRTVVLFCDNHAISVGFEQTAALMTALTYPMYSRKRPHAPPY